MGERPKKEKIIGKYFMKGQSLMRASLRRVIQLRASRTVRSWRPPHVPILLVGQRIRSIYDGEEQYEAGVTRRQGKQ